MEKHEVKLGELLRGGEQRDAIHIAVAPVVAAHSLSPGEVIGFVRDGDTELVGESKAPLGIVDPYLKAPVRKGERFWLFLFPNTITSLRHEWTHPSFAAIAANPESVPVDKSASELWMRGWASNHMRRDYYGDREFFSEEEAYANAIRAGHTMSVGCYEEAREYIEDEWWSHWEIITGEKGQRGGYFRCAC